MQIKLWDWQLGIQTLSYSSGHHNNVFQARKEGLGRAAAHRQLMPAAGAPHATHPPAAEHLPAAIAAQARIMPHSGNGTVVSCAADGLVRVGCIPPGAGGASVETRRLACHRGRAHKLALEPDSASCFLSCGEGGL